MSSSISKADQTTNFFRCLSAKLVPVTIRCEAIKRILDGQLKGRLFPGITIEVDETPDQCLFSQNKPAYLNGFIIYRIHENPSTMMDVIMRRKPVQGASVTALEVESGLDQTECESQLMLNVIARVEALGIKTLVVKFLQPSKIGFYDSVAQKAGVSLSAFHESFKPQYYWVVFDLTKKSE